MDLDVWLPTASPFVTPEVLAAVGCEAEERGVHAIWVGEHAVEFADYASSYPYSPGGKMPMPPESGLLEPFTTLSFLAAHTRRVRLGTAVCVLPQRNPVYVAKEVVTLDWLSGGRAEFGVGVGWLREEFEALNVPWPQRGARTDEFLDVVD
ncbi:MAG TPA: LLM class flavin-dependent oxidoreductase, partial [Acidimicrobiales bacterium]|nr:LLM class flavin-dependent oxidoreductase [Acidimicrobiales bacterium]